MSNVIKVIEIIPKKANTVVKHKKVMTHPWKTTAFPTMEFTTNIPLKGCPVDCVFCPQRVLTKAYSDLTMLSLGSFKHMVDKLPAEIRITFAGGGRDRSRLIQDIDEHGLSNICFFAEVTCFC